MFAFVGGRRGNDGREASLRVTFEQVCRGQRGRGNSENRDPEAGAGLPRVMDSTGAGGPGLAGDESGVRG